MDPPTRESDEERPMSSSMRSTGGSSVMGLFRNLQSRGGIHSRGAGAGAGVGVGDGGGADEFPLRESSPMTGSLYDMMGESMMGQRVNTLDFIGEDKMLRIKRGLWFIVRGQKIHTIDGVADFFEQVKEEMARQQMRDESSRAGGTASLVENMANAFSSSVSMGSSSSGGAGSGGGGSGGSGDGRPSSAFSGMGTPIVSTGTSVSSNSSFRSVVGHTAAVKASAASPSPDADRQQQQEQQQEEEEPVNNKQQKYFARDILDAPIESAEQAEQRGYTEFIDEWSDAVSMCIVASQLFVLVSVFLHVGFNLPIYTSNIVCDKLFGDLVALISIVYRFVAPYKEFGTWHFNKWERTKRYFWSGALFVDVIGVFPVDLIGLGLGHHCALFRADRCGLVGAHFQLNRIVQCRGMLSNFGTVSETLFLRRGLHPILGRVAQVLLFLLCLTHIVACTWNFLLSRGDKAGLISFTEVDTASEFEERDVSFQYFLILDWAIKSLVGLSPRGTSFPDPALDQAFVIVVTIIGVAVFTNFLATVKLYFDRDCPEKTHGQLLDETIDMVQYMSLDDGFRDETLDYFNHMFKARFHLSGMRDFEDDLAGGLARKLRFVVGRELVEHIPLLKSLRDNEPFIVSLMQRIEPLVLPPNTVIFRRDEAGSTMLVLVKGFVDVLSPGDDKSVVAKLGPGKVVGEVALLMDAPRTATVVSCDEFINVLSLDRRQMSELIMLFPEIAPIMMKEMATRMHQLKVAASMRHKNNASFRGGGAGAGAAPVDSEKPTAEPSTSPTKNS